MACPPSLQQNLCWPQLTWHETVSPAWLVSSCHQGPQPLSHRDVLTSGSQGGIAASQSRGGEGLNHTESSGREQEAMSQSTPDLSCHTQWEGYRPICSRRQHNIQIISKASWDGKKHINEIQSQNALMAVILSPEAQAPSNYLQRGRMKKRLTSFLLFFRSDLNRVTEEKPRMLALRHSLWLNPGQFHSSPIVQTWNVFVTICFVKYLHSKWRWEKEKKKQRNGIVNRMQYKVTVTEKLCCGHKIVQHINSLLHISPAQSPQNTDGSGSGTRECTMQGLSLFFHQTGMKYVQYTRDLLKFKIIEGIS